MLFVRGGLLRYLSRSLIFAGACLLLGRLAFGAPVSAALWQWSDLVPSSEPFDDPFLNLSQAQLDDLGYLVGLSEDIAMLEHRNPDYARLSVMRAERDQLTRELTLQDVNVAHLLSMREKVAETRQQMATATVDEILGTTGALHGFLVPLQGNESEASRYFFVEFSPLQAYGHEHFSPHPNQTILVEVGEHWGHRYECPVIVSGELQATQHRKTVVTPDGHEILMESAYSLDDASVELVQSECDPG